MAVDRPYEKPSVVSFQQSSEPCSVLQFRLMNKSWRNIIVKSYVYLHFDSYNSRCAKTVEIIQINNQYIRDLEYFQKTKFILFFFFILMSMNQIFFAVYWSLKLIGIKINNRTTRWPWINKWNWMWNFFHRSFLLTCLKRLKNK
jgi:hypothetical protein